MVKRFKTILISTLVLLWSLPGVAQQIYQTKDGSIGVIGLYKDAKTIEVGFHNKRSLKLSNE